MEGLDHLLNWRLLRGSHEFPGKDGGTCINEAAVIAAGFDYRRICKVTQIPSCFSRPICEFAMFLNDQADDEERQRLLPLLCAWLAPTLRRSSSNGRTTYGRWCLGI